MFMQNLFQFRAREMIDRFFFLPGFEIEIDAAVVKFAKFFVESGQKFARRFAMPGH